MSLISDSDENKITIPIVTGPTGSGKTSICLDLLKTFPDLHIISADSRQIYKHLNIGTDKPNPKILDENNFHLVDCIEPGDRFTAFDFIEQAHQIIKDTLAVSKYPPVVCGGTGLYLRALVEGLVEIPDDDLSYRQQLENETIVKGPQYLFEKLQKIDPLEAEKIHPHNIKKIIRALEIYHLTGKPKSELLAAGHEVGKKNEYVLFCLMPERDQLYNKINLRVDQMIKEGLLDEVNSLIQRGMKDKVKEINVIGYNELFRCLDNDFSLEEAINLIKQNSRRYAKRQITWFKGMENIEFINSGNIILERLVEFYNNINN